MIFKPPSGDPEERSPGRPERKPKGITARVEAAARAHAPAPKGKGVVMILLGVAVVVALIWDFTGRGAASRAIRESVDDGKRPVPEADPDEPPDGGTATTTPPPVVAPGKFIIKVEVKDGARLGVTPPDAAALLASAPPEGRPDLRRRILEALAAPTALKGSSAGQALEAAAWFARNAGTECAAAVAQITVNAYPALDDDRSAHAAILFLAQVPDRGGAAGGAVLDRVILEAKRPLHLRIAAARIRPAEGRPPKVLALAGDPATHPALREALGD